MRQKQKKGDVELISIYADMVASAMERYRKESAAADHVAGVRPAMSAAKYFFAGSEKRKGTFRMIRAYNLLTLLVDTFTAKNTANHRVFW